MSKTPSTTITCPASQTSSVCDILDETLAPGVGIGCRKSRQHVNMTEIIVETPIDGDSPLMDHIVETASYTDDGLWVSTYDSHYEKWVDVFFLYGNRMVVKAV